MPRSVPSRSTGEGHDRLGLLAVELGAHPSEHDLSAFGPIGSTDAHAGPHAHDAAP